MNEILDILIELKYASLSYKWVAKIRKFTEDDENKRYRSE